MLRKAYREIAKVSVTFQCLFGLILLSSTGLLAAPPNRITLPVDAQRSSVLPGQVHRLAQPRFDLGLADPSMPMNYIVLMVKPSTPQQTDLESLLEDLQNPSSPNFHNWLTPEQFGNRFGLSLSDQSKVVAWLTSQGFTVDHRARSQNWIAFSGTAAQVSSGLHTSIHRFQVNGETHFANTIDPAVPEALEGVVGGFLGLNDFHLTSFAKLVPPQYNIGGVHYMVPADFATIYDVSPLYQANITGTGQSIAVVGESDVLLSDIVAFRARYGLPVNNPQMLPYSSTDPGFNAAQLEGNLDLEWAGALAPNATIYYVYGPSAFTALLAAVEADIAPVVTASYGACEVDFPTSQYRSVAQQGNAEGITILASSGDAGAAGCDVQQSEPLATRGLSVMFPASLPEVTAVGGTEFVEGSGTYWASTNSANFGSVLSYIPEAVWNESDSTGLYASGGGASQFNSKPAWQSGPGVPNDGARDVPDLALSAAYHDGYYIYYQGSSVAVFGTSCAAPSMAALIALLNQYQKSQGFQKTSGLGNINPQLYRLAQSVPAAFHDIISGNNMVQCAQGTPNCATGMVGYPAGPGYDQTTGLGSIDANLLITNWHTATNGVTVTLTASPTTGTVNNTVQLTATVAAASGSGTPTGSVTFVSNTIPLGTVSLAAGGTASLMFPLYELGVVGTATIAAEYSGDAAFSSGGATRNIRVTTTLGAAAIIPSAPNTVWPQPPDAQGLSWQTTLSLSEVAGVAAIVTGFTIDGQAQTLSQYFPSPDIPPNSTVNANVVFRNMSVPVTRIFGFAGIDADGNTWSRQLSVNYYALPGYNFFNLTATPLTVAQNPAADPSCQWSVQLNVDDLGGFGVNLLSQLYVGGLIDTAQIPSIFGTTRLNAWEDVQGTLCFGGITPPASDEIEVILSNGNSQDVTVSFVGPVATPSTLTATPASVTLSAATPTKPAQATLAIHLSESQPWTAAIYPPNVTTGWLSASQLSGTGSASITLTALGTGFEPGAYKATLVIQCANSVPQYIDVPIAFLLGASTSGTAITGVANSASFQTAVSPGMLLSVFGTKLSNTTQGASIVPLPYLSQGVTATVNGLAAPILYQSASLVNIQVPYEVGAGPAVLGINNNGQIATLEFPISPSSPGIFTDVNGNVAPNPIVNQGALTTLYVTGTGDVSPALKTAYPVPSGTPLADLPLPVLPLSVTVGGTPAFVQFAGTSPGLIGTTQINVIVPSSVPPGNQPVVVTVASVKSAPANIVVQASPSSGQ